MIRPLMELSLPQGLKLIKNRYTDNRISVALKLYCISQRLTGKHLFLYSDRLVLSVGWRHGNATWIGDRTRWNQDDVFVLRRQQHLKFKLRQQRQLDKIIHCCDLQYILLDTLLIF